MKRMLSAARSLWKSVVRAGGKIAKGAIVAVATELAVVGLKHVIGAAFGAACLLA